MSNSYVLRVYENENGMMFHREVHAFASPEEAEAFVAESRATLVPSNGATVSHSSISEDVANGLIEEIGAVCHGGAEYTDAMYYFDEDERRQLEDDLYWDED